MSDNSGYRSRRNRYEKRRVNTKMINWLSIVGVLLVLVIISVSVFGKKDDTDKVASHQEEDKDETVMDTDTDPATEIADDEIDIPVVVEEDHNLSESEEENREALPEMETEIVISSVETDDPNVKLAYEGNWKPVGTQQEGPHTIQYDEDSQDRNEMMLALEQAIEIPVEDQIIWWIGRAGDQQVEITTTSRVNQAEIYRVHLEWIDNQGWRPMLVEELIENDAPTATNQEAEENDPEENDPEENDPEENDPEENDIDETTSDNEES